MELTGSRTGNTTIISGATSAEIETIITFLGGEQELLRREMNADKMRKNPDHRRALPGPASYWRAILLNDLTGLVRLYKKKGEAAMQTARWWGMPQELLEAVRAEASTASDRALGRPVGSGDGRTITKRVRLTATEDAELDKQVTESGLTWSQYVRGKLSQSTADLLEHIKGEIDGERAQAAHYSDTDSASNDDLQSNAYHTGRADGLTDLLGWIGRV